MFLQICCCQEVPRVKQKAIAGNSFVDRPLRLLCREVMAQDRDSDESPRSWKAWYSR